MKTILKAMLATGSLVALCASAVVPAASLLENPEVKVSRALEKTHVKGSFHEHKMNRVMVYLQGGKQRFEFQDGRKPVVRTYKAGQVLWSAPEGMHAGEVVTDESFNIVEVELKKPGGATTPAGDRDPLKVDAKQYKLELENPQVRVLRLKLAPHQSTPIVKGSYNAVAVFLNDQSLKVTTVEGKVETFNPKLGDASFETPGARKVENTGETPAEIVLVELKN